MNKLAKGIIDIQLLQKKHIYETHIMQKIYWYELEKLLNPLSANPTKWSYILKQFSFPPNCLSVFDHFVRLALKGLRFP